MITPYRAPCRGPLVFALALILVAGCRRPEGGRETQPGPAETAAESEPAVQPREIAPTARNREAVELFLRGRDALEASSLAQARQLLAAALQRDPEFALALALLGSITPGPAGERQLERAELLAAALPEAERLLIVREAALRSGEEEKALAALDRLGTLAPADFRVQLALGDRAVAEGRLEEGARLLRGATRLNPASAQAFNHLGFVLADLGDLPAAVNSMRRYVVLLKDKPNPLDSLGEVLLRAGRSGDAEAAFSRALRLDPTFWYAGVGFAQSRFLRGDAASARAQIERLLAASPPPVEALQLRTWLAWSYLAQGARERAMEEVDRIGREAQAQKLAGFHARAALLQARFLLETGNAPSALAALEVAGKRARNPGVSGDEANVLRRKGLVLRVRALSAIGRLDEADLAVEALERERQVAPSNAELASAVRYARGSILDARGAHKEAAQELAKCLQTDWTCRAAFSFVQRRAGDPKGAEATRATLLAQPQRDPVWDGADASYLWAHTLLTRQPR